MKYEVNQSFPLCRRERPVRRRNVFRRPPGGSGIGRCGATDCSEYWACVDPERRKIQGMMTVRDAIM